MEANSSTPAGACWTPIRRECARYATASGYQLIATNWVIKKTIVEPTLGPTIDRVTGADQTWELPQVL